MGIVGKVVLAVVALLFLAGGVISVASEFGGEVVKLQTQDAEGGLYTTPLWLVEDRGQLWLRAGSASAAWLVRLRDQPAVDLERGGRRARYRAEVVPRQRDRINRLMAEKYGWADDIVSVLHSDEETVAIRLDPIRS